MNRSPHSEPPPSNASPSECSPSKSGVQPGPNAALAAIRRLESTIARVLRAGTLLSLTVIVLGAGTTLVQHPDYLSGPAGLDAIRLPHANVHSLTNLVTGLRRGEGEAVMLLGLLLLVATPVMRVLLSAIAFVKIGDRAFALLTGGVLILLLISFMLGRTG